MEHSVREENIEELVRAVIAEHPGDFRHDFVAVEIMPGLVLWRLVVNGVELGKPEWN